MYTVYTKAPFIPEEPKGTSAFSSATRTTRHFKLKATLNSVQLCYVFHIHFTCSLLIFSETDKDVLAKQS